MSSPWPEGISIISVDSNAGLGELPKKYEVEGHVLEMTSTGVFADSGKVAVTVVEENGKWVIDAVNFSK